MDDDTKDFSELKIDDTNEENYDDTIEMDEEELLTVSEQLKEIKEEKINDKIEEIKIEQDNNKKLNRTLIILIILFSIFIIILLVLFFENKKPISNDNNVTTITRPSDQLEYTILKQNQVSLLCNKSSTGEKILSLKRGLIIECNLQITANENITELYFDLNNSKNLKIKEYRNDSDYELINDKNTYLLKSKTPFNDLNDKVKFYFEVIDITEKTGYAEIKNIIFKDNMNNYYKMINSIIAFPPEYTDKIFIYKQTVDNEVFYVDSKTLLNEENLELIDTYKCSNDLCEVKNSHKNYFIIYDNNLLIYDVLQRTKQTIKIDDKKFDYSEYEYEPITNKDGYLSGVLFKKNYKDNTNCDIKEDYCIETSISGFENSYYSINNNMFTIALDYGFIGANVYTDYDKALLLSKNNKYGVFSYEEDAMILELSKKYISIEYESDLDLVKLGRYDKDDKEYYYSYYNIDSNSFVIDVNKVKSINNSNKIYYIEEINKEGKTIYMLFNANGEALVDIPYSMTIDLEIIDDKTFVIKNNDNFDIYDLNGNYIETSEYVQSGLKVQKTTSSYLLALNSENKLIVTNQIGKTIANLMPSNNINEIYEVDTMSIVKCEENNSTLEVIITNPNITEDGKNAYKFTMNKNGNVSLEYTYYE